MGTGRVLVRSTRNYFEIPDNKNENTGRRKVEGQFEINVLIL